MLMPAARVAVANTTLMMPASYDAELTMSHSLYSLPLCAAAELLCRPLASGPAGYERWPVCARQPRLHIPTNMAAEWHGAIAPVMCLGRAGMLYYEPGKLQAAEMSQTTAGAPSPKLQERERMQGATEGHNDAGITHQRVHRPQIPLYTHRRGSSPCWNRPSIKDFQPGRQPAWWEATPARRAGTRSSRTASGCSNLRTRHQLMTQLTLCLPMPSRMGMVAGGDGPDLAESVGDAAAGAAQLDPLVLRG